MTAAIYQQLFTNPDSLRYWSEYVRSQLAEAAADDKSSVALPAPSVAGKVGQFQLDLR